jgi:hypothetical protein
MLETKTQYERLLESNFNPDMLRMLLNDAYLNGFQTALLHVAAKIEGGKFDSLSSSETANRIRETFL